MPFFNDVFYDLKDPDQKKEYMRLYSAEWRRKNPDKHKDICSRSYEKIKSDPERWKKWLEYKKKYPVDKEKNRQRAAAYYAKPEKRAKSLERAKVRYATDEAFRKRINERSKAYFKKLKEQIQQSSS